MSCNIKDVTDEVLRLLCVDGLGARTLSTLVQGSGGLEDAALTILSGEVEWCMAVVEKLVEEHGRDAFGVPGRTGDSASAGGLK